MIWQLMVSQRCRELLVRAAANMEVVEQLRMWAEELEREAEARPETGKPRLALSAQAAS